MNRLTALVIALMACATAAAIPATPAQADLHRPLDIPLLLSGNFGELRNNHFHSGLDFKTQGRTGYKIYCAADGYVSRVLVSPWGFGRAIYVTHPSLGLTTVYGHLEGFNEAIAAEVLKHQEAARSFRVDFQLAPGKIAVKRGEVIGYSGNAGSSGGPHLHMDVRDAATEEALDPMPYFRNLITDKAAPQTRSITLFPVKATIDGANRPSTREAAKISVPFKAWGTVYPGIKAYDMMTGTTNIYGIKHLALEVDGKEVYRRTIDRFNFDDTRALNTLIDYPSRIKNNSWTMITAVPPSLPLGPMIKGDGTINIDEERPYRCQFIMEDEHGNRTVTPFTIFGEKAPIPNTEPRGTLVRWDKPATLKAQGAKAQLPERALYDDTYLTMSAETSETYLSPIVTVGSSTVPLHRSFDLEIPLTRDNLKEKRQYCVVRLDGKNLSAVDGKYVNGKMRASVNRFGRYAVTTDTKAPTITPVNQPKWNATNTLKLKIADALSGIQNYSGEIDGAWVVMELDGKSGTLSYRIDRKRFKTNEPHQLKLTVTDACGNSAKASYIF